MSDGLMVATGHGVTQTGRKSKTADSQTKRQQSAPPETLVHLVTLVESQIIPRLLAADRPPAPGNNRNNRNNFASLLAHDIEAFTELLLADNMVAVASFIELWRAKGVNVETIYLELLTGAARHLGTLWGDDECNFCEVGLAIWRIQQTMYELRPAFFAERGAVVPTGYRVLLAPMALEQHTLGVMMTAEFFRRAGWDVSSELPAKNEALVDAVRNEYVDLIGISVSNDAALAALPTTIASVKQASRNEHLVVIVGGWMFMDQPEKATAMGADFCVADVRDAVLKAEKFVASAYEAAARVGRVSAKQGRD